MPSKFQLENTLSFVKFIFQVEVTEAEVSEGLVVFLCQPLSLPGCQLAGLAGLGQGARQVLHHELSEGQQGVVNVSQLLPHPASLLCCGPVHYSLCQSEDINSRAVPSER